MNDSVEEYLNKSENENLDFKRTEALDDTDSIAKQLVSFANRNGGKLIFGITDSREIQGSNIQEDLQVGRISKVAREKCSPPIDISHEFYPDQKGEHNKGDVLVIDISQNIYTPSAVTDGSARKYYIRTANESRPITDPQELQWLYENTSDTLIEEDGRAFITFESELKPHLVDPFPNSYRNIENFLDSLSDSDREFLLEEKGRLERLIAEITPFALLSYIGEKPDFWIGYADEEYDHQTIMDVILADGEYDEVRLSDVQYTSETVFEEHGNGQEVPEPVVSQLSISPIDWLTEPRDTNRLSAKSIVIPIGTEIIVEHLDDNTSRITFEKEGCFEFWLDSYKGSVDDGLPDYHPLSKGDSGYSNFSTLSTYMYLKCQYEFPDFEDPNITQHTAFGEGLGKLVNREWDYNHHIDGNYGHIVRLEEKIDNIESKIDAFMERN